MRLLLFCFISLQTVIGDKIKIVRDFRYPTWDDFSVYWNAPSFVCQKYGINFSSYLSEYGILSNANDAFRGSAITIMYDPGAFPALLKEQTSGRMVERNGAIPQRGNLSYHLDLFTDALNQLVPNKSHSGLLVLDAEMWRVIWRQNWNDQVAYLNYSKDWVRQRYPYWSESRILSQAQKEFEAGSRTFLQTTLELAQTLRPNAQCGYYGYPYCYNMRPDNGMSASCSKQVQMENNRIQWLWDSSSALYPSIYMSEKLSTADQKASVMGRLNEGFRLSSRTSTTDIPPVYPYLWYKYYDSLNFLSEDDLYTALDTTIRYKLGGMVIWGASNDFTTQDKCQQVLSYLKTTLGPTIKSVKDKFYRYNDAPVGSPVNVSQLSQVSPPVIIFTAINGNQTKSIYQYVDSGGPPAYVTQHGDRYTYSIDPNPDDDDDPQPTSTSRTIRSTTRTTPPLNNIVKWYQRMLRALFKK